MIALFRWRLVALFAMVLAGTADVTAIEAGPDTRLDRAAVRAAIAELKGPPAAAVPALKLLDRMFIRASGDAAQIKALSGPERGQPQQLMLVDLDDALPGIEKLAGSAEAETATAALSALGNLGELGQMINHPMAVLPAIRARLGGSDDKLRQTALLAVRDLGPAGAAALPELTRLLGELTTALPAAWALAAIGPAARPALRELLVRSAASVDVEEAALPAIFKIIKGSKDVPPGLLPLLITALRRPDAAGEHRVALEIVAELGPAAAPLVADLVPLLAWGKPEMVRRALTAINATKALKPDLLDPVQRVAVVTTLERVLQRWGRSMRLAAATALLRLDGANPAAHAYLQEQARRATPDKRAKIQAFLARHPRPSPASGAAPRPAVPARPSAFEPIELTVQAIAGEAPDFVAVVEYLGEQHLVSTGTRFPAEDPELQAVSVTGTVVLVRELDSGLTATCGIGESGSSSPWQSPRPERTRGVVRTLAIAGDSPNLTALVDLDDSLYLVRDGSGLPPDGIGHKLRVREVTRHAVQYAPETGGPSQRSALEPQESPTAATAVPPALKADRDVLALARYLHHPESSYRREAAQLLARWAPAARRVAPELEDALEHEDDLDAAAQITRALAAAGLTREAVARAVGRARAAPDAAGRYPPITALRFFGPAARDAVGFLVESLDHREQDVWATAALALCAVDSTQPRLREVLREKLGAADPSVRRLAATLLCDMLHGESAAAPVVLEWLADGKDTRRHAAARAAGGMGPDGSRALPLLVALLPRSGKERKGALIGLERLALTTAPALSALCDAARSPDEELAVAALHALRGGGPACAAAIPVVGDLAGAKSLEVRRAATLVISEIAAAPTTAPAALLSAMEDQDLYVRIGAARALRAIERVPATLVDALRGDLTSPEHTRRTEAALTLARLLAPDDARSDELAPVLLPELNIGGVIRREAALRALIDCGRPLAGVEPVLQRLLDDPSDQVRLFAVRAVASLGKEGLAFGPALERFLASDDRGLRLAALFGLRGLLAHSSEARRAVIAATRDVDDTVRYAACESLGFAGAVGIAGADGPALVDALAGRLVDSLYLTRRSAAKQLGRLGAAARSAIPALEASQDDYLAAPEVHAALTALRATPRPPKVAPSTR